MTNASDDGEAFSRVPEKAFAAPDALTDRHLHMVPALSAFAHEHTWALRDTEHYDYGLTVNRFECDCGGVSYT